eukprot:3288634-Amphidinium_carterae.1
MLCSQREREREGAIGLNAGQMLSSETIFVCVKQVKHTSPRNDSTGSRLYLRGGRMCVRLSKLKHRSRPMEDHHRKMI